MDVGRKVELTLEELKARLGEGAVIEKENEQYVIFDENFPNVRFVLPNYEYAFIGGYAVGLMLSRTDLYSSIQAFVFKKPTAADYSEVKYFCCRYVKKDDVIYYYAVDPNVGDYNAISVSAEWSIQDGTQGMAVTDFKVPGVTLLDNLRDTYGLDGVQVFMISTENDNARGIIDEYRDHMLNLLKAGADYAEEFEQRKAEFSGKVMQNVEILLEISECKITFQGEESVEIKFSDTDEEFELRFDQIGYITSEELLSKYKDASDAEN